MDNTIIGEYIGGYFNNHIEKYNQESIVFFAVVKKNQFEDDLLDI
jgi:hypothetical protein